MVRLNTTGTIANVSIADLGNRTFSHPTVDYDITIESTYEEIRNSDDLWNAIELGYITIHDNENILIDSLAKLRLIQPKNSGGGVCAWGSIVGDIEDQDDLQTALSNKVDKEAGKGLSTNDYTDADQLKLSGIEAGAEVNVIEGVQKNGVDLTVTDKKVNVTVPVNLSELTEDETHRTVTDTEKGTWNGKQDALGFTPEDSANKVSSFQLTPDDTHYPTEKLVKDSLDGKAPTIHNHSGQSINPDNIVINKSYTDAEAALLSIGTLFYNSDQQDWMLKTSDDTYANWDGEVTPLMKNVDSFTHLNGQPVYVSGGTGKFPVVKLADADTAATSHIIAIATQDVVNTGSGRGRYCAFGGVSTVPISNVIKTGESDTLWVEGAVLYVSSETGKLTTVKPIAPAHAIAVGYITDRSGANINMFVNIQCGSELSELHDVLLTNPQVDDILIKDTNYWKNIAKSIFLSGLEVILTFTSGLTRTLNTITNDLITGKAQAKFDGNTTRGHVAVVSPSTAGNGQSIAVPSGTPSQTSHWQEFGHIEETVSNGAGSIATVTLHFN